MNVPGVVIVGAGQGGFQAAASLRQEGYVGNITLSGAELGYPTNVTGHSGASFLEVACPVR